MKSVIRKYIGKIFALLLVIFTSCEDGNEVFDQIVADEQRGAVLRTVSTLESEALYDVASSTIIGGGFSVILEEQDQQNGDLLSSVDVFLGFLDNTDSGTDNSRDEISLETIPGSAFSTGEFGLPRVEYSLTAEEMQTALGLTGDQIFGGDQFTIRFELVLTDGRRFSNDDNSGTITGSYFSSPFLYNMNVVCAPSVPTAGTWTVSTTDTYGDGWNGGSLEIVLDGSDEAISIENEDTTGPYPQESIQEFTFEVPAGTLSIQISYVSGAFDEEVLFTITSANGNVVAEEGPEPPAGVELLDFCPDNL